MRLDFFIFEQPNHVFKIAFSLSLYNICVLAPSSVARLSGLCLLFSASLILGMNSSQAAQAEAPTLDNQKFNACLDNLVQTGPFAGVKDTFAQYRPQQGDLQVFLSL